jgi:uncharacterized protein
VEQEQAMAGSPVTSISFAVAPTLGGRGRALGLAALFLVVAVAVVLAAIFGLHWAGLGPVVRPSHLTLPLQLARQWAAAGGTVLAVVLLALVTREPLSRLGFATRGAWRDFPVGLAAGFAVMAGSLAAIAAMGGCDFGGVTLPLGRILGLGAVYLLLDAGVAVLEETLFRSFILVQLSRALSWWPAAILSSVLFGLAHAGNVNEAPLGLVMAGSFGLALAYSFRRSGALWFALGGHVAYDFAEDFLFGVPDSGKVPENALLHTVLHGPAWLTGGTVGPEASLLVLPAPLVLALLARLALPRREV